jgi:hypothetical protein
MEREMGFEPTTLALARRCSTTELFPLNTVYFLTLAWLESQHSLPTDDNNVLMIDKEEKW